MNKPKIKINMNGTKAVIKQRSITLITFKWNSDRNAYDIDFKEQALEAMLVNPEGKSLLESVLSELLFIKSRYEFFTFFKKSAKDSIESKMRYYFNQSKKGLR